MSGTVDVGIDLGTTNSAVALLRGVDTEVLKNNDGDETTPSAVWVDRRERLYVGRAARDRAEADPDNTCMEFKLRMGTAGVAKRFAASGREMSAEELSAEVLKSLRADVRQRIGSEIGAAVVTVPAAFDIHSCDATRRAAELAGLTFSPLLQEPTAAALAYGFQASEENALWLVYDLGGGTFDAAVIQLRDGEFSVVNDRGDNFLGGKLIDWKIVEELLIPEAVRQAPALAGLRRGDPRWFAAVNKLKLAAETAKIRLSRVDTADILVELDDGAGGRFEIDFELGRADVERMAEPLLVRSINLCHKALRERSLTPADIEKVILVGGPTLTPYLRERLADPVHGLGIPLDHSQDPMTVVARGAAVFAGTQRLPATPVVAADGFAVRFEYQPVGPDTEPLVAGRISPASPGLSVEFVNAGTRPPWRSGRISVSDAGLFASSLWAEPGRLNTFAVELTDATGSRREVDPDHITYTVGAVETEPPLTHSIGVGLDGNEAMWLLERGTGLPARRSVTLRTTVDGLIRIPVLEGEYHRADRNRRIGRLEFDTGRALPSGSEVVFTIEIDASRLIRASAYVPMLDEEFQDTLNLRTEVAPSQPALVRAFDVERSRLAEVRERQRVLGNPVAEVLIGRIDSERMLHDVDTLVSAAKSDPDAATAAERRLLDLRVAIDDAEDELAWPSLVNEARGMIAEARDLAGGPDLPLYETAINDAIEAREADLLRQRMEELRLHVMRELDRSGVLQLHFFHALREMRGEMRNGVHADRLIAEGDRAVEAGEFTRLRGVNMQLRDLLPEPPLPPDPFSTVDRAR
ncbi:Hsp70 family protein [Allokutzneria albata]|uniref:Molecular chaperone DnaK n=1 Tax=Allokutzneria albata TaxID=211114 RepID=A0A1G9UMR9_ALLAB|nr:Hsp70 family protein [Allokutzneria albata]SDM61167.1 molecular chaperone DnaK [Allokutzneria albata]